MRLKTNQKGFSLLEMVIVVAIMGVLMGLIGVSLSYLNRTNLKQALNNTIGVMDTAKTTAMTKAGTVGVYFEGTDSGVQVWVAKRADDGTVTTYGDAYTISKKFAVTFVSSGSSVELTTSGNVFISFKRTSGAFDSVYVNGSSSGQIDQIQIGNSSNGIKLYWNTGKYEKL